MNEKEHTKLVRAVFEEVYSASNVNAMDKYFAENVQLRDPAVPKFKGGLEDYKKMELQYIHAFPDKKVTINDILATENKVVVNWTCTATHKGPLGGYAGTGNKIKVTGISIFELNPKGKIAAVTQIWDRLALLEQIGQARPLALKS